MTRARRSILIHTILIHTILIHTISVVIFIVVGSGSLSTAQAALRFDAITNNSGRSSNSRAAVATSSLTILSPSNNGMVIGNSARFVVKCRRRRLARLVRTTERMEWTAHVTSTNTDESTTTATDVIQVVPLNWTKQEYAGRYVADLPLSLVGTHTVVLRGSCHGRTNQRSNNQNNQQQQQSKTITFSNAMATTSVAVADHVIRSFVARHRPTELRWNWGPAIFLFPLTRLAQKSVHRDSYLTYVAQYNQHHMTTGLPDIKYADECPSALSSFELAVSYQDTTYWPNVERVVQWIQTKPRNALDSIDHVGDHLLGNLVYPSSIWVDSLVMWGLLTVKYALLTNNEPLLEFGLTQPLTFYQALYDPHTGLLYHAWNIEQNRPLPRHNVPWLRGNGWALWSMAEVLTLLQQRELEYDALGSSTINTTTTTTTASSVNTTQTTSSTMALLIRTRRAEISANFVALAQAALPYRQVSGYWDTVMAEPGYAYEESSGSALVATAWARGVTLGLLPPEYRTYAMDTFAAVTARLQRQPPQRRGRRRETPPLQDTYTLEDVSIGTNPSGRVGYRILPVRPNINYGVGAFLLLADELSDVDFYKTEV